MKSRITRREFLKRVGQSGLGLCLGASLASLTACITSSEKRAFLPYHELSERSSRDLPEASWEIFRYPYLQDPTTSSIKIAWKTKKPGKGEIRYGLTPDLEQTMLGLTPVDYHLIQLSNLEPGAQYYYQVLGDGIPLSEVETFKTAKPSDSRSFSFIAFGDSGNGSKNQYQVAEVMKSLQFDLAILTGDVVYPRGGAEDFDPHYFLPYRDLIKKIPFFPSLGNHDLMSRNGQAYLEAFHVPSNNPLQTKRYYSFRHANALFIALDTNEELLYDSEQAYVSPQYAWLVRELQRAMDDASIAWRFVFCHHPPYSSGYHGQGGRKKWLAQLRETLVPLFEKYRVDVVFTGHDHNYERTYPIREGNIESNSRLNTGGITYVVTGGGGKGNGFWRRTYKSQPWSACFEDAFHLTHVEIDQDVLTLQAIDDRGTVIDTTTLQKSLI